MTDTDDDYVIDLGGSAARPPLPATEYVRPCAFIPPDTKEFEGCPTFAQRFAALTERLPLAGADALRPSPGGMLAITGHLRAEAPWMQTAIDLLDEQFRAAIWSGRPWIAHRPLLLIGPPGSGKSHLARLLAQRAGVGFTLMSMAGVFDAASIEGVPRSYTQSYPCLPAIAMQDARTANPVIVLDELEKAGGSKRHGDPHAALLNLLEPLTASGFYDRCLMAHVNVSHVNWIMTANSLAGVPAPLKSRLDIVEVKGPGPEHFDALLRNLIRDVAARWRMPVNMLPDIVPAAEDVLRSRFERHRSARQLGREVQAALAVGLRLSSRTIN